MVQTPAQHTSPVLLHGVLQERQAVHQSCQVRFSRPDVAAWYLESGLSGSCLQQAGDLGTGVAWQHLPPSAAHPHPPQFCLSIRHWPPQQTKPGWQRFLPHGWHGGSSGLSAT
jgi:hypothetical protein